MYVSFRSKNDIRKLSTMVAGSLFEKSESPSKRKVVEEDFQRISFIIFWNFANFVKRNLIYNLKVFAWKLPYKLLIIV